MVDGPWTHYPYAISHQPSAMSYFLFLEPYPVRSLLDPAALLRLDHLVRHPIELFEHDRLAAHAGHERDDDRPLRALVERAADLGVERAAAADAAEPHVRFDDADDLELAERLHDAVGRIRTDGPQPHHADLRATLAHVLDRVARG